MHQPTRPFTRRRFLLQTAGTVAATAASRAAVPGANETIRFGLIGCGGRMRGLAKQFGSIKDTRIVAVCDADTAHMDAILSHLGKSAQGASPRRFTDYRKLLDRDDIDAVVIASPNHWHALQTIDACKAGKDVYVEKPVSHNIWEGVQMAAAAAKSKRIVQAGFQNRSDTGLRRAFKFIQDGRLGKIRSVRGLCYRNRSSIGKRDTPLDPPATIDYNLWLGPARDQPIMRPKFHYDWHWIFNTGNGDIGNQGPHELDLVRWVLGDPALPAAVQCFGERFAWNDAGDTPNMQTAWFEMGGVPCIFEVNDMKTTPKTNASPAFKSIRVGIIVTCEEGEFRGGRGGGYVVGPDGKERIRKFPGDAGKGHQKNFIDAVRSRRVEDLRAPVREAHRSSALAHLANLSVRTGTHTPLDELKKALARKEELLEVLDRQTRQLAAWKVDLDRTPYRLGPSVQLDPDTESVTGPSPAAQLYKPDYRRPFVVPELT